MGRRMVVGVIGSGDEIQPSVENARRLGELIARQGWVVLSGGRDAGVMRAVNEGAKSVEGSLTVGVLPNSSARVAPHVDVAIVTDVNNARNNIIGLSCDVVVACGAGGAGTASEIALALKNGKSVALLAVEDSFYDFFQRLAPDRVFRAETPEETIRAIRERGLV